MTEIDIPQYSEEQQRAESVKLYLQSTPEERLLWLEEAQEFIAQTMTQEKYELIQKIRQREN